MLMEQEMNWDDIESNDDVGNCGDDGDGQNHKKYKKIAYQIQK